MQLSIPLAAERYNHTLPALDSTVLCLLMNIKLCYHCSSRTKSEKPLWKTWKVREVFGSGEFRYVGVGGYGQRMHVDARGLRLNCHSQHGGGDS